MRKRPSSRQLFVVDLVTLLLLVLVVAMRIGIKTEQGKPGVQDAISVRFVSTRDQTEGGDPTFGVALVGRDREPIIGKPIGILEDPEQRRIVQIYSVLDRVCVDIYLSPENIAKEDARLIVFARDRGTRTERNLGVRAQYFDRENRVWETLRYSKEDKVDETIRMIEKDHVLFATAIAEIRLAALIQGVERAWHPIGENE